MRRSGGREFVSRSYNRLLERAFGWGISDAQCGFKAVRAEAARELLPNVRDDGFFFDTELLAMARAKDMRIEQIPVIWRAGERSTVNVPKTSLENLAKIAELRRRVRGLGLSTRAR